jgi:predicted enzyme related to lactoylglutathione lyase
MPSPIHGRFLWLELITPDVQAALKFYPGVCGWTTMEWPMEPEPYHMVAVGEVPVGGALRKTAEMGPPDAPPFWLGYIGADNADQTYAAITKAGGTGHREPFDVPSVGRLAIAADPSGAVFALLQPADPKPPVFPPPLGHLSWSELTTTDVAGAVAFYSGLFGWTKSGEFDMGPGGMYTLVSIGGNQLVGVYKASPDQGPPCWLYYTHVASVQNAIDTAKANGASVLNGPMEVPGGDTVAALMDPAGAAFALHQKTA